MPDRVKAVRSGPVTIRPRRVSWMTVPRTDASPEPTASATADEALLLAIYPALRLGLAPEAQG